MGVARDKVTSVLPPDGRVLIIGGFETPPDGGPAEIFDPDGPATGFQLGPNMKHGRGYHSAAILLPAGSVIVGGDPNGATTPKRAIPAPQLGLGLDLGERCQTVLTLDFPGMFELRFLPVGVALHARRVFDSQLLGKVAHQLGRNLQRIRKEHAEMPHRNDLKGKAQSVVIAAPRLDQPPVLVVQG